MLFMMLKHLSDKELDNKRLTLEQLYMRAKMNGATVILKHIINKIVEVDDEIVLRQKQTQFGQPRGSPQQSYYHPKYVHNQVQINQTQGQPPMTPSSPTIRIWWDPSVSAYRLTSPYSKDLVDALKQFIPSSDRSYDSPTKVWTISEKYFNFVLQTCEKLLHNKPQVLSRAQVEAAATGTSSSAPQRSVNIDTAIVQFVKLLPYEAAQSAYRKAAMLLHPDRGGDMAKMSQVNALWTRIEKEVFNQ